MIDISAFKGIELPTKQELTEREKIEDRARIIMKVGECLTVPARTAWGRPSNENIIGREWLEGLQKDDLNDVNNHGLFVLGYGDAKSPYGAGPTRDPRRATYGARLLVRFEDMPIFSRNLFRTVESEPIKELNAWIEENMKQEKYRTLEAGQFYDIKFDFWFCVGNTSFSGRFANLTRRKDGFASHAVLGDLVLVLNDGYFSGQYFIRDPEIRDSSPLYGKLEHIFSESSEVYQKIGATLQRTLDNQKKLVGGLVERIDIEPDYAGLITIDNT